MTLSAQTPTIPETFLRDARYFSTWVDHGNPRNVARAVLLAAIASEVMIKGTLRERASGQMQTLVASFVDRFRPIRDLLDGPFAAVTGTSLKTADPALYKDVGDLFTLRNRIAHQGALPDKTEGYAAIGAAERLFRWLETL